MGNIYLWILIAYVLYYSGNIIYDLFFLKDKTLAVESEGELVSISRDPPEVKNFGVDDIEDIEVPSSYDADDSQLSEADEENPSSYDIEAARKNYEELEELNQYSEAEKLEDENMERSNHDKKEMASQLLSKLNIPTDQVISSQSEVIPKMTDDRFNGFLQTAVDHVVVDNQPNGHRVFKSSL